MKNTTPLFSTDFIDLFAILRINTFNISDAFKNPDSHALL